MIRRVHHIQITIPPNGEERARDFYCRQLGLPEIAKPEVLAGRGGLWLEVAGFEVHLGVEQDPPGSMSKAHIAYEVDNLEAWRARLNSAGVDFLEDTPLPKWNRIKVRDPFGNLIELLETVDG